MKDGMKIRQRIFRKHGFGQFAVLMSIGDDGPNFVFFERFVDGAPRVTRLGSFAGKTGIRGEQDFHATFRCGSTKSGRA